MPSNRRRRPLVTVVDRERRIYSGAQIDDLLAESKVSPGRTISVKVSYGGSRPKSERWMVRELFTHQIDAVACTYALRRSGTDKAADPARRKGIRAIKIAAGRLAAVLAVEAGEVPDHPVGALLRAELQAQQELWPEISKAFPGLLPTTFYDDGHSATDFPAQALLNRLARAAAVMAKVGESADQLVIAEMKQRRKSSGGGAAALHILIEGLLQIWVETLDGQIAAASANGIGVSDGPMLRFLAKALKPLDIVKSQDGLRALVRRMADRGRK